MREGREQGAEGRVRLFGRMVDALPLGVAYVEIEPLL